MRPRNEWEKWINFHGELFLRGAGTAIALPALEAMIPHKALAAGNVEFPTRMAFVYIPNGVIQKDWNVKGEGSGYHMSRTLQPMEKHRGRFARTEWVGAREGGSQWRWRWGSCTGQCNFSDGLSGSQNQRGGYSVRRFR